MEPTFSCGCDANSPTCHILTMTGGTWGCASDAMRSGEGGWVFQTGYACPWPDLLITVHTAFQWLPHASLYQVSL